MVAGVLRASIPRGPAGSFKTSYEVLETYFQFILVPKQVTKASLRSGEEDQTTPLNKRSNEGIAAIFNTIYVTLKY